MGEYSHQEDCSCHSIQKTALPAEEGLFIKFAISYHKSIDLYLSFDHYLPVGHYDIIKIVRLLKCNRKAGPFKCFPCAIP